MNHYTIGQLAKATDVTVETIRYYERRGLISQPARINGEYRRYPDSTAERILFIKKNQTLGFTLREIGELLALLDGIGVDSRDAATLLDQKIDQIEKKMEAYKETLDILRILKQSLVADCPVDKVFSIHGCLNSYGCTD